MTRTEVKTYQIKNGEVKRSDLNTTESGSAVITKIVAGTNISVSSTGADSGTGDVTVSLNATNLIASQLSTPRTISATGDASWSVSFDGSANVSSGLTLSNSGVTAGTYPKVTVDSKGRVTTGTSLAATDIPSLDASKITTGQISIARGGTGSTTAQTAINALTQVSSATNEHILTKDTSTGNAIWKAAPITSAVTSLNSLTATTQTFATGTSGTDFNISSSTSTHTFNIPTASATARGLVSTSAQTFAGLKTFSNGLDANNNTINNVASPVSANDAATKAYVDSITFPMDVKSSCRVATTANITLSGTQTIDGVSVVAGDRVLVKNQDTASENGIYVVASGSWSRSADADSSSEVTANMFVFISEGSTQADTQWVLTTNDAITLGTTGLTFSQFGSAPGTGLDTLNALSTKSQSFATGTTGSDFNISSSGSTHTFNIPDASATNRGAVTTGAQTFAGVKTFSSAPNLSGLTASLPLKLDASKNITSAAINIASGSSEITGTLAIASGGTGATTNSAARTNLGASTVGSNLFTLTNPSAITFIRVNADNTISTLNSTDFRTAIGAGVGTVTSVGLSLPGIFSVTGSPVTSTGTLTASLSTQTANLVFAGPTTGAAAVPSFRSLVSNDIPSLDASKITTGQLPIANGGTGASTAQTAINALTQVSSATNEFVLTKDTSTGNATWKALPSGVVSITSLNTLTTSTQTFATGTSGSDFNISSSGSTHTFNIPDASATNRGVVTTTSQTFAGVKTFSSAPNLSSLTASLPLKLDASKNITASAISIASGSSDITGTLPITSGGTGATTNSAARTNLGATTVGSNIFTLTNPSAITFIRMNADNTVSALNATDFRTAIGAGTGTISSLNALTGVTQTFATGTSGTDFNISSSGSTHTFNIPDASATNRGAVTTGAQTFAGTKTFSNGINVNNNVISNVGTPVSGTDAATKAYVDSITFPLDVKNSCRAATTGNITLSGTQTIDGVSVVAGDRVLVKNQNTASQNGIYVVSTGAWTRSTDADTSSKVTANMFVFISEGSTQADTQWVLSTNDPIVLDTTALTFGQFGTFGVGGIANLNTLTTTTQTFATGTSGSDFNISSSGSTHTFNIPDASATNRGAVTTGAQTFAGAKTLTGNTTIETSSTSPALRVTQTGTGPAIRVEDSASPDSTPFIVDADGKLLLNTTAAEANSIASINGVTNFGGSGQLYITPNFYGNHGIADNATFQNVGGSAIVPAVNGDVSGLNIGGAAVNVFCSAGATAGGAIPSGNIRNYTFTTTGLGIGASPNARLQVSGGDVFVDESYKIYFTPSGGTAKRAFIRTETHGSDKGLIFGNWTPSNSSDTDRVTIRGDSGNVGIGTGTPNFKLEISGSGAGTNLAINGRELSYKTISKTPTLATRAVSAWNTKSVGNTLWNSICWSPELGLFCAVSGFGEIMTSSDTINWSYPVPPAYLQWTSVCWSPELGIFCAVAATGTGNRVITSPDGVNWTSRTSAGDHFWASVCWSPELGLFCAVAVVGALGCIMTSPDGITWTIRNSGTPNYHESVCWSPELGLFCAVTSFGNPGERVVTSSNGITWTAYAGAADYEWKSVCWSSELGIFVSVSSTGTGNRVMTSPDGITWTLRNSASNNNWKSVSWSPELGMFVATATSGTGNRLMSSPDGITWTSRTSSADIEWNGICWCPELGIFVAAGGGNVVMRSRDVGAYVSGSTSANATANIRGVITTGAQTIAGNKTLTGTLAIPDGTAGSPALFFSADTNTGFFRQTDDRMAFVANGQNSLVIDGTSGVGRLMIGDGAPASRMQVADDGTTATSGITLGTNATTNVEIYRSASRTLTVNNAITTVSGGAATTPAISVGGDTNTGVFGPAADTLAIATNGTERVRVTSTGAVGIGTNNPSHKVHITHNSGTEAGLFVNQDGSGTIATFQSTGQPDGVLINSSVKAGSYSLKITHSHSSVGDRGAFFSGHATDTARQMVQLANGNVGIGTNNPAGVLHVVGEVRAANHILSGGQIELNALGSGNRNSYIDFHSADAVDYNARLLREPGTNGNWVFANLGAGVISMYQSSGGVLLTAGATSWAANSDERAKDIIEPITDGLAKVQTLRSVIGKYKTDDENVRRAFLIAQDVEAVLPEAVTVQEDEQNTRVLRIADIIPLLVSAIKDLGTKVEALDAEIKTLKHD